jgi:hypothetical protein
MSWNPERHRAIDTTVKKIAIFLARALADGQEFF